MNIKQVWARCQAGGYYELAIEASLTDESNPIKAYTKTLFSLPNVEGPLDYELEPQEMSDPDHHCIITLESGDELPFRIIPLAIKGGSTWYVIAIPASCLENILGEEYQTWHMNDNETKFHEGLDHALLIILHHLNTVHPIRMAMLGHETNGEWDLELLRAKPLTEESEYYRFYTTSEHYDSILEATKPEVQVID
jgi:hypothetical protein